MHSIRLLLRSSLPAAAALLLLAACSGGGDGPTGGSTGSGLVARVEITSAAPTLTALDDTVRLAAVARDAQGKPVTSAAVSWQALGDHGATVSASGLVKATQIGDQRIVATSGTCSDTIVVHVTQVPRKFVVAVDSLRFGAIGDGQALYPFAVDANDHAIGGSALMTSRSAAVARVDGNTVIAAGNGTTWIDLTLDSLRDSLRVTVQQVPGSLVLDTQALAIDAIGGTATIAYHALDSRGNLIPGWTTTVFSTSDSSVVAISGTGTLTALKNGTATVSVYTGVASQTQTLAVAVVQIVTSLVPSADSLTFTALEQHQAPPTAKAYDRLGNEVVGATAIGGLSQCNGCIVSYANGELVSKANGRAIFVLTGDNGVRVEVPIIVRQRAATVTISPRSLTINELSTGTLAASAVDANGYAIASPTVAWSTADESTATVSADGVVGGVNAGVTTITAKVDAASATATVTVRALAP